jgi:hypothetical protein
MHRGNQMSPFSPAAAGRADRKRRGEARLQVPRGGERRTCKPSNDRHRTYVRLLRRAIAGHHCIAGDAATATAMLLGASTTYCGDCYCVHLQRTACCYYRYIYNVLLAATTGTSTTYCLLLLQAHLQRTTCCYNYFHNAQRVLQLRFFRRGAAPGGYARQRVVSAGLLHGDLSLGLGRFQRPDVLPATSGEQGQRLLSQPVGAALPGTAAYHCEPL